MWLRTSLRFFPVVIFLLLNSAQSQSRAVKEWSADYDGPGHSVDLPSCAILDEHRNFYITGRSVGEFPAPDIATIRYSSSGQEVLTLRYNAPANSWDEGNSIAVDDSGNIYVAGTSFIASDRQEAVLLKYSPAGDLLWHSHFPSDTLGGATASKICFDSLGNICLAGSYKRQMLYLRYNRAGVLVNSATIGDDTSLHRATDIVVGGGGVVYLAGAWQYVVPGHDVPTVECAVVKIDTQGQQYWRTYWVSGAACAMRLDANGDIIVITQGDHPGTAKLSPNGMMQWFRESQSTSPSIAVLTGLAIDSRNRIIVSGYGCDVGCFDFMAVWYDADGNVVRFRSYNSPDTLRDFCMGLAIDRQDNVYLTGMTSATYADGKCLTVKYDSAGNSVWETVYSVAPNSIDEGQFIDVDDSGCVYLGGMSAALNGWDYFVIKYRQDVSVGVVPLPTHGIPSRFSLQQNFPNPFNPSTTIPFALPSKSFVTLKVFDLLGREVVVLVSEELQAGVHSRRWNAEGLPSGVYLCRMSAGSYTQAMKLVLLR